MTETFSLQHTGKTELSRCADSEEGGGDSPALRLHFLLVVLLAQIFALAPNPPPPLLPFPLSLYVSSLALTLLCRHIDGFLSPPINQLETGGRKECRSAFQFSILNTIRNEIRNLLHIPQFRFNKRHRFSITGSAYVSRAAYYAASTVIIEVNDNVGCESFLPHLLTRSNH